MAKMNTATASARIKELIDQQCGGSQQIEELAPVTPSEPPQAILALQGLSISEIYEMLTKEEKRRFWRGIIKEIRVDHDGNIFYDFL